LDSVYYLLLLLLHTSGLHVSKNYWSLKIKSRYCQCDKAMLCLIGISVYPLLFTNGSHRCYHVSQEKQQW